MEDKEHTHGWKIFREESTLWPLFGRKIYMICETCGDIKAIKL